MNKKIRVSCVQKYTIPGDMDYNLMKYEEGIKEAAENSAELVVFPELFSTGYIPNITSLKYAEKEEGKTIKWMKTQAIKYKVYIGGGVSIFENGQCYNRFYIINQNGDISGYAQKENGEAYCFKRGEGKHLIKTKLAMIGVGICADNHFVNVIKQLKESEAEIILMPHAWPSPRPKNRLSKKTSDLLIKEIKNFPIMVSKIIGKPIIFVNQIGEMDYMQGLMGKAMNNNDFSLMGYSAIIQSNGQIDSQAGSTDAVLNSEVYLTKNNSDNNPVPNYSGWINPGSKFLRKFLIPIDIFIGSRVYNKKVQKIDI